jgi:hypothetical protein
MYAYVSKTTQRICMWFFLIDREIQEEGLYVYNMHNIVEKHFCISIAAMQSQDG